MKNGLSYQEQLRAYEVKHEMVCMGISANGGSFVVEEAIGDGRITEEDIEELYQEWKSSEMQRETDMIYAWFYNEEGVSREEEELERMGKSLMYFDMKRRNWVYA